MPIRSVFMAFAALGSILVLAGCHWWGRSTAPPLAVVPSVDLSRYAGTWYEIAKYPNRFQRGCVGATAEYTLSPDGKRVEVVNRCREIDTGKARSVRGKARVVDPTTNAKLSVTFFWPFSGDYWILALGEEYEYAFVGTPDRKYLWFLARTPTIGDDLYGHLVDLARARGFDPARIERSER
jgi:apolipoprotein D and lipocalin family protein